MSTRQRQRSRTVQQLQAERVRAHHGYMEPLPGARTQAQHSDLDLEYDLEYFRPHMNLLWGLAMDSHVVTV